MDRKMRPPDPLIVCPSVLTEAAPSTFLATTACAAARADRYYFRHTPCTDSAPARVDKCWIHCVLTLLAPTADPPVLTDAAAPCSRGTRCLARLGCCCYGGTSSIAAAASIEPSSRLKSTSEESRSRTCIRNNSSFVVQDSGFTYKDPLWSL